MTDRDQMCSHGRSVYPCPCGTPDCVTCDPHNADDLETRIADTRRGVECRYDRGQDHAWEPKRCRDGVTHAIAELVREEFGHEHERQRYDYNRAVRGGIAPYIADRNTARDERDAAIARAERAEIQRDNACEKFAQAAGYELEPEELGGANE